jgi:hypothetical protein
MLFENIFIVGTKSVKSMVVLRIKKTEIVVIERNNINLESSEFLDLAVC